MATITPPPRVSPQLQSVLSRLRRRIRIFVWVEGLALAAIWFGILYWLFLAIDYLPILVGATEMPVFARALYLTVLLAGGAYIFYRWILRRAFVRLRNESMAVLLERHYGEFHDGLLTSVQMAEHADHAEAFNRSMLDRTSAEALSHLGKVQVGRVFNVAPLIIKIIAAVVLLLSIFVFGFAAPSAFGLAGERLFLLSSETWPRAAQIEVLGFPSDQTRKVALGSDFALEIRARTDREVVPKYCWVYYETEDGDRGRLQALREGQPHDNFQYYVCREGPFDGIIDSFTFDVVGHDHRLNDFQLQMVKSPTIVESSVRVEYPEYLVDAEHSLFMPQVKDVTPGMSLERGSHVSLILRSNKDLAEAVISIEGREDPVTISLADDSREVPSGEAPQRYLEYDLGILEAPLQIEVLLKDTDEVTSQQPYRVAIGMTQDQPPQIDARLSGIGTAVTPDARIPMIGTVRDDYGVHEAWMEMIIDGDLERPPYYFSVNRGEISGAEIDLFDERSLPEGALDLRPGQSLTILARASDRYDLAGPDLPNIGSGDRYELEVVTADDLLRILERRELELRQRFEQIVEETRLARDMLQRVVSTTRGDLPDITAEPGDRITEPGDEPEADPAERREELRGVSILRVQRSMQHSQKAGPEITGVAIGFQSICLEIENNRIDASERMQRLQNQVAAPLLNISENMLPAWELKLAEVELLLNEDQDATIAAEEALVQADAVLAEMERILGGMLNMQDFNEIVDYLRDMIESQEEIREATSDLRRRQALELLEGG